MKRIMMTWLAISAVYLPVFCQTERFDKHINVEEYSHQVEQKFNLLKAYFELICHKERYSTLQQQTEADKSKDLYIKDVMELFIGAGKPFTDSSGIKHPAPIARLFTITPEGRTIFRESKIEEFLNKAKYLKYKDIQIESVLAYYPTQILGKDIDESTITMETRLYPIKSDHRNCKLQTVTMKLSRKYVDGHSIWQTYFGDVNIIITK